MTIINIRGTSGSGKTTVVKRVFAHLDSPVYVTREGGGRNRVAGVICGRLFAVGKYDQACGGADSLSWSGSAEFITELLKDYKNQEYNVLLEGLMVSTWGTDRLVKLHSELGMKIIQLTTPIEDCLALVQARRDERAKEKDKTLPPFNPRNTIKKYEDVVRGGKRLVNRGMPVEFLGREAAYLRVCELLALPVNSK